MPTTTTLITSVFALLLSLSRTRAALLITDPLLLTQQPNAGLNTSTPPSSNQLPTCVNSFANPNWTGAIDPIGCNDAYQLLRDRVQENLHTSYTFYSQQAFPTRDQRPPNGWPLPQGASSGTCAVVIRMARDFSSMALPIVGHTSFFPTTGSSPFQTETWLSMFGDAGFVVYGLCGWG